MSSSSQIGGTERNLALHERNNALRSGIPGARENAVGARSSTVTGSTRISRKKTVPLSTTTTTALHTRIDPMHTSVGARVYSYTPLRRSSVVYHDRPYSISRTPHYEYIFNDRYDHLRHRIIWPRYSFVLGYHCGPYFRFQYHYPYYFRKYLFVSLGGYWPLSYRYRRYYWYGYHPYYWYGYYPIAREVDTGSYNYYTYNYYNTDSVYPQEQVAEQAAYEQLGKQPAEPDAVTLVDTYFDEAVKGFAAGNYDKAVEEFARAADLAPNDMVLPFAYSQALMANKQYSKAAEVLRAALAKITPDKEGVFYPRGLYPKDDVLMEQIDDLAEKAELFSSDADLQLLLGYQLLGIGRVDQALSPLMFASKDMVDANAAGVLLKLLEKIKTANAEAGTENSTPTPNAAPSPVPAPGNSLTPDPAPAPNRPPLRLPFDKPEQSKATTEPIGLSSWAIARQERMEAQRKIQNGKGTLLAALCAVSAGAGIHHFGKC